MKALQLLILLSIIVLSFTTCKKYPQDGKLSFETPDKRLRRVWTLTECLVDGDDVTNTEYTFNFSSVNTVIYKLKDASLEFKYYKTRINGKIEKHHESYLLVSCFWNSINGKITATGNYNLEQNKKNLKFNTNNNLPEDFPLLFNYTNESWNIKKLVKTELIIETTNSNGNTIKVTFKGQ